MYIPREVQSPQPFPFFSLFLAKSSTVQYLFFERMAQGEHGTAFCIGPGPEKKVFFICREFGVQKDSSIPYIVSGFHFLFQ
jgi:hypothetical protein